MTNLKSYQFEIYTFSPDGKISGYDIQIVNVFATDWNKARKLRKKTPLYIATLRNQGIREMDEKDQAAFADGYLYRIL